jgi:simple sugar transport system permease protein
VSEILTIAFLSGLMAACIRLTIPILFTALGEAVSEQAGILNIGLEGYMLAGALAGFAGAYFLGGNLWMGVLIALIVGGVLGFLIGFLTITLRADQVVAGVALNIFALGVTNFSFRLIFSDQLKSPTTKPFPTYPIPLLSDIPVLGGALFDQSLFVYLGYLLVPATWVLLYKADSAGVSVYGVRYACVVIAGALGAMGGAFLTLGSLNVFVENVTAGRGFIALTAVIFGGWHPWKILGACLFFGLADAIQLRMQALDFGIPYQFLLMTPYVLTLIALFSLAGRTKAPSAITIPFAKESR